MGEPFASLEECAAVRDQIVAVAQMVQNVEAGRFAEACELAHTTGPILDPTAYRLAGKTMDDLADLARALHAFQAKAAPILERLRRKEAGGG